MIRKIKLEPVPQGRPKVTFANGRIWTYNPTASRKAQEAIREALSRKPIEKFSPHIPLKLTVTFFRCKSKWLKRHESMPYRKPDLDNYLKLLLDALNGIAFADDAQITTMIVKKRWTPESQAVKRGKPRPTKAKGYIKFSISEDNDNA